MCDQAAYLRWESYSEKCIGVQVYIVVDIGWKGMYGRLGVWRGMYGCLQVHDRASRGR